MLTLTEAGFGTPGSGWHQLIHIVSGAVLIAAGVLGGAVVAASGFGAMYLFLAAAGTIDGHTVLGLFDTHPVDRVLHALLGGAAVTAAVLSRPSARPAALS